MDVSYTIIKSSTLPGIKRSLDVRINKKVSERTLRALALKLKSDDTREYERTFICYYLPNMTVDAGAWAGSGHRAFPEGLESDPKRRQGGDDFS